MSNIIKSNENDIHIKDDPVKHPSHYADGTSIECIESMTIILGFHGVINFCIGNAYKYIWRHKLKNKPVEDLRKATWYLHKATEIIQTCPDDDFTLELKQIEYIDYILSQYIREIEKGGLYDVETEEE